MLIVAVGLVILDLDVEEMSWLQQYNDPDQFLPENRLLNVRRVENVEKKYEDILVMVKVFAVTMMNWNHLEEFSEKGLQLFSEC